MIDLSLHPSLTTAEVSALPPDRRYKYQIERSALELSVSKAMQKKFDLIMAERTVVCEATAFLTPSRKGQFGRRPFGSFFGT